MNSQNLRGRFRACLTIARPVLTLEGARAGLKGPLESWPGLNRASGKLAESQADLWMNSERVGS